MTRQNLQDVPRVDKTQDWFLSHSINKQYDLVRDLFFKASRVDMAQAVKALNSHACAWGQYAALCAIIEGKVQHD